MASTDFEPADSVSGESLRDFLDQALATEEASRPPDTDVTVQEILRAAYTREDGWCAVQVSDDYGRSYELAAPCYEDLEDSVKRFLRC